MLSAALGAIKLVSRLARRIVFMFLHSILHFQARIRVPRTYVTAAVTNSNHDGVISTNVAIPPFLGPGESPSIQSTLFS